MENYLPRQVQKQVEEAEATHAKMFGQQTEEETVVDNVEPEVPETPAVEEEVEDSPEETTPEYDVPHDDDLEELRKFKARYLTLKGMYDADVPRLHKELKELKQSVFDRFNTIIEDKEKTEPQVPVVDDEMSKFEEEYGTDFVQQLRKIIANEASQYVKPIKEQVDSVEDTQVQTAKSSFVDYLNTAVKGDWQNAWQGNDPKFQEFLNSTDPNGLYTYAELIDKYNTEWDADKMAKIFNIYYDSQKPATPIPEKTRPDKEAMIAPSRQPAQSTPQSEEKIIWTKDKLAEFQRLDRMGKYPKEDSLKLWNDLLAAPAEGRFR